MHKRPVMATSLVTLTLVLLGALILSNSLFVQPAPAVARAAGGGGGGGASPTAPGSLSLQDLHAFFFVWASGTPAVQQPAAEDCRQLALSASQCDSVSGAVRAAWLHLAELDPTAVGRPEAAANPRGRAQVLAALSTQLATLTNGRVAALVAATEV